MSETALTLTSSGLQLAGRINLSREGADFPEDLTEAEWLSAGKAFCLAGESTYFWIGDWMLAATTFENRQLHGNNHQGKKIFAEVYEKALAMFSLSKDTLKACRWVANSVPRHIRRHELTWAHHQQVASLAPSPDASDEQKEKAIESQVMWMDWAIKQKATIEQLRIATRAYKSGNSKMIPSSATPIIQDRKKYPDTAVTLKGDDLGQVTNLSLVAESCRSMQRVMDWYEDNAMESIGDVAKKQLQADLDPMIEKIGKFVELYESMK